MSTNDSLNTSTTEFGIGIPYLHGIRIFLICSVSALILIGVPGNLILIGTILKHKTLRVRHNMFIVNLAIADAMIVSFILPFNLAELILGRYPVEKDACIAIFLLTYTTVMVEFINIVLIAACRYTKVCKRTVFEKIFTCNGTLALCIISWVIGPLSMIPVLMNPSLVIYSKFVHSCVFDLVQLSILRYILPILMVVAYFMTSLCYVRIWKHVQKSEKSIVRHGNENFARMRHSVYRNRILSNIIVFGLFISLQTPLPFVYFWFPSAPASLQGLFVDLFISTSSINFIVYGVLNKSITHTYRRVMPAIRALPEEPIKILPVSVPTPAPPANLEIPTVYA